MTVPKVSRVLMRWKECRPGATYRFFDPTAFPTRPGRFERTRRKPPGPGSGSGRLSRPEPESPISPPEGGG